jgi:hypothetical protein
VRITLEEAMQYGTVSGRQERERAVRMYIIAEEPSPANKTRSQKYAYKKKKISL